MLVAFDIQDDAAVYGLNEQLALVETVDFVTPIVDDPYHFGQIAAANALSHVYAMERRTDNGSVRCWLSRSCRLAALEETLRGSPKMNEARCRVMRGHSTRNEHALSGYAVTGLVALHRVGARLGDMLVLTKPLGSGVIHHRLAKGSR